MSPLVTQHRPLSPLFRLVNPYLLGSIPHVKKERNGRRTEETDAVDGSDTKTSGNERWLVDTGSLITDSLSHLISSV